MEVEHLLSNRKRYATQIRTVIAQVYEEYKNDDNVNDALLWEMIKLKIREKSMQYAAAKKAKISRKEEELEKTINALQNLVDSNRIGEKEKQSALNELEDKRIQLEKIVEYKTKGAILRAKCRWHNEGEKNTKYFLNLEKRHFKNGVINQLKIGENAFTTTNKEILKECESFYKKIYSSKIDAQEIERNKLFFGESTTKSLDPQDREKCEGLLTKMECLQALKTMESNKTTGSDGLPAEFYKFFWADVSEYLVNSLNHAYGSGQLSVTQRRGIIKLYRKRMQNRS